MYGTKGKDKERKRKEGTPRIYRKFERARNSSIDLEPSWDYTNHNHDTSWKRTNYTLHQTGNVLRFFYDISTVLPIADLKSRRMDVVVVGKSEHGGKNELEIRRHRRRRRRRNAKLTKVGRFARRKRERKKSVTRYEPTGSGKSCKREEKKVYIHISIEWH